MVKQSQGPYEPVKVEKKWQKVWETSEIFSPDLEHAKKPFYNLMMFPYPSAEGLHVGNMYAFTGADIYGRYTRMKGFDVFEPIGLDGFGIHSENYALKIGRHPAEQAKISEKNFYRQLHATGNAYDWSRTIETYSPDYYKWTQWIFVQMFKKRLAYKAEAPVNWCPSCKTVLADEQVLPAGRQVINARPQRLSASDGGRGKCERCSSVVERRQLAQWFFRITNYADRLLDGLSEINWSEKVKIAQRNWIGRSEGALVKFSIFNFQFSIDVFTTRPDTLFGATFMVLASEHPLVEKITTSEYTKKISEYIKDVSGRSQTIEDKEKTGVFTGAYAINPVNQEKIPIWIADYVSMEYGTGAIMGVPAHDQRDFEFAKKYSLKIIPVIQPSDISSKVAGKLVDRQTEKLEDAYEGEGIIINSGDWNGWKVPQDIPKIIEWLEKKKIGKKQVNYHLRDWLISRQRYWGPPIPMIYCEVCAREGKGEREDMPGWYAVPEKDLPVKLPYIKDYRPTGTGVAPLASHKEFFEVECPHCGARAHRETDVSDTFLDSAWYFFRYTSTEDKTCPWMPERARKWLPVDMYIGGAEHSVLHLLYARFLTMAFKDMRLISHFEEPFKKFYAHGLLISEGAKMSKSRGNVVIPDEYIQKYGADTLRMYLMFLGPFDQGGDFRDTGIAGMYKFLKRVWNLVMDSRVLPRVIPPTYAKASAGRPASTSVLVPRSSKSEVGSGSLPPVSPASYLQMMHKTIKEVTEDLENLRYNTAIAHIMEYVNYLHKDKSAINKEQLTILLLILAPFAPHMTEELFQFLRNSKFEIRNSKIDGKWKMENGKFESIHLQPWPKYDRELIREEEVTILVQVDGKLRATITISNHQSTIKEKVEEEVRKNDRIAKWLNGRMVKKVIFVPGKLINFVTK